MSIQLANVMKSCSSLNAVAYCKRELTSQTATSSVKKLESLTQARCFALCSLYEINAAQNISKLIQYINIDSLSIYQHLFDNINKKNT